VSAEALRGGGGADSFVQFPLEKGSRKVYNYSTTLEKSMPRPAFGGSRQPNRTDFSGQKEIPDSVRSRKEKF